MIIVVVSSEFWLDLALKFEIIYLLTIIYHSESLSQLSSLFGMLFLTDGYLVGFLVIEISASMSPQTPSLRFPRQPQT
ncbi:hypothetical protein H8959_005558 [Pygathrix nigripes]